MTQESWLDKMAGELDGNYLGLCSLPIYEMETKAVLQVFGTTSEPS